VKKKAKKRSAKGRRKRSAVKDLRPKKAGSVRGGATITEAPAVTTIRGGITAIQPGVTMKWMPAP